MSSFGIWIDCHCIRQFFTNARVAEYDTMGMILGDMARRMIPGAFFMQSQPPALDDLLFVESRWRPR